jgi:hypothetical protein
VALAVFVGAFLLDAALTLPTTATDPGPGATVDSSPVDHLMRRSRPTTPITTPSRSAPPTFVGAMRTRSPTTGMSHLSWRNILRKGTSRTHSSIFGRSCKPMALRDEGWETRPQPELRGTFTRELGVDAGGNAVDIGQRLYRRQLHRGGLRSGAALARVNARTPRLRAASRAAVVRLAVAPIVG